MLSRVQSVTRVDSTSRSSSDVANKKRKQALPSLFVNKRRKFPGGHSSKTTRYIRDIVLLPREWVKDHQNVTIPRKERRKTAQAGLIGKIEFDSDMSGEDVIKEVCRVFANPMGLSPQLVESGERFKFRYLQKAGAGSRSLCCPSVSTTFEWTGKMVSTVAKSGGCIYLLADEDIPNLYGVSDSVFILFYIDDYSLVHVE